MTQKLERFYGFKVWLDDDLTPLEEKVLNSVAANLARVNDIDPSRFAVYFHHLRIRPSGTDFSFGGGIENKLLWLILQFDVNKKQAETGAIRFFNSEFPGDNLPEHQGKNIIPSYSDLSVSFQIPGKYFSSLNYFKSAIITFMDPSIIRIDHRKIKATVTAIPTPNYAPLIRNSENRVPHTKIDVAFKKNVQLRLPLPRGDTKMDPNDEFPAPSGSTTNNFYVRQAMNVGTNNRASNVTQNFNDDPEASQLRLLLAHLAKNHAEKQDVELRQAVSTQDRAEAKSILSRTGPWLIEAGEKVGVPLAVAFLKSAMGL